MLEIKKVEKDGIGSEIGLRPKDKIVAFDGFSVVDILDYEYYDAQEFFILTVLRDGEEFEFEIEKDFDETLGLEFVSDNLELKTCRNNCVFCFIDQMPKGMRDTLYIKDDDYRQSFLCGNYVTLTNVTDSDIERIIRLNLSPLYVSVHATDENVRKILLNNRFAGKINEYLKRLNDGGVLIHTQVVLVKGLNDGEILDKTMKDLSSLENVLSLAVVPCGITEHRDGLYPIEDIDEDYSKKVIKQIDNFNKKLGRNLVLCADEFYIRAKIEMQNTDFYGEFDQLENGVGGIRLFEKEFDEVCEKRCYRRTFLVVTGVSAKNFIEKFAKKTEELVEGLKVFILGAENLFFGKTVTCAGLLTGQDILNAINSFSGEFDELLISSVMLKNGEPLFIDGKTLKDISKEIKKPIRVVENDGASFFNSLSSDNYYLLVEGGD